MFVLADALSWLLFCVWHLLNTFERRINAFWGFLLQDRVWKWWLTNKKQTVSCAPHFFIWAFSEPPSALSALTMTQVRLSYLKSFRALISFSVGSCNCRIRLPKQSALGCSCPFLRGLSPLTSGSCSWGQEMTELKHLLRCQWLLIWGGFHLDQNHRLTIVLWSDEQNRDPNIKVTAPFLRDYKKIH